MPIKIIAPLEETFTLDEVDKVFGLEEGEEPTRVTIRQATQAANEKRERVFRSIIHRNAIDIEDIAVSNEWTYSELVRTEAWLTMVECNIIGDDGKPLFKFKKGKDGRSYMDMNEHQFKNAWGKLPPLVVEEIIEKVHEVNKTWTPGGEG